VTDISCTREQDVLDAVASGRWSGELRAHAASCAVCADVADVARAFRDDEAWGPGGLGGSNIQVPPSGRVWWRAELRARQEAARAAAAPIGVVHAVAAICAAALALVVAGLQWPRVADALGSVWTWAGSLPATAAHPLAFAIGVALGAGLLLASVALYFVFSE